MFVQVHHQLAGAEREQLPGLADQAGGGLQAAAGG